MPIGRPSNDRQLNPRLGPRGQRGESVCIMYTKTRRIRRESGQRAGSGSPRRRKREKTRDEKEEEQEVEVEVEVEGEEEADSRMNTILLLSAEPAASSVRCSSSCGQELLPFFVLSSSLPPPPLANSSLTRLWNKLAVLGLFQRAMGNREGGGVVCQKK